VQWSYRNGNKVKGRICCGRKNGCPCFDVGTVRFQRKLRTPAQGAKHDRRKTQKQKGKSKREGSYVTCLRTVQHLDTIGYVRCKSVFLPLGNFRWHLGLVKSSGCVRLRDLEKRGWEVLVGLSRT
jgi:hypothetical protein